MKKNEKEPIIPSWSMTVERRQGNFTSGERINTVARNGETRRSEITDWNCHLGMANIVGAF
jgi:hypothetical protein